MDFLLTDQHVKLLQTMRFGSYRTDCSAKLLEMMPIAKPSLDISESFGNPDTYKGMERILGLQTEDKLSDKRRLFLDCYLAELPIALSIVMRNGHFVTGLYAITRMEELKLKAALNQAILRPILDALQNDASVSLSTFGVIQSISEWIIGDSPYEEFVAKLKELHFKDDDPVMVIVKNSKDLMGDFNLSRANLRN